MCWRADQADGIVVSVYTAVFVFALTLQYALETWVDRLNMRAVRSSPPPQFRDVYDASRYERSGAYLRARTRLGLWARTSRLLLLLGFWLAGGFDSLDRWARSFELGEIATGLLFIGVLSAAQSVFGLPFRYYSTFVIEERFGFNRTSHRTFISDLIKGTLLGLVLGGALASIVLWVFERAGAMAPLYGWLAMTALMLFVQFVAPSWIFPLFIKFMPLQQDQLRERIVAYCESIGVPIDKLFVVDGSRRSNKANAFFTGFGRNRRIGLFDTLIERHTEDEVVAVVAHEVGHYKLKHVTRGMLLGIAHMGVLFFAFGYGMRQPALFDAFFMQHASVYAGLVLCSVLYGPVELALSVLFHARSRKHEFEADSFAIETTGLGPALANGLKKLSADSLDNLTPHPAYVLLHYTHPPLVERLARIEARAATT
jgi:STE24 endopeptidase